MKFSWKPDLFQDFHNLEFSLIEMSLELKKWPIAGWVRIEATLPILDAEITRIFGLINTHCAAHKKKKAGLADIEGFKHVLVKPGF